MDQDLANDINIACYVPAGNGAFEPIADRIRNLVVRSGNCVKYQGIDNHRSGLYNDSIMYNGSYSVPIQAALVCSAAWKDGYHEQRDKDEAWHLHEKILSEAQGWFSQ